MTRLFGTDGVRGIANDELTPELAYKIGRAAAKVLGKREKGKIVVGKDTRQSGDMLGAALIAGVNSMGLDVVELGVVPTPAVSYLTREYGAVAGVVISASHNPGEYNGIKLFDRDGLKLSDELEREIESYILDKEVDYRPRGKEVGRISYDIKGGKIYKNYLREVIDVDISNYKIVVDCGNGALFNLAPNLLENMGAEVIVVNDEPDGMNINDNCGSTNPKITSELVLEHEADIGISFDGDGDRIIAIDDKGNIVDGDHILAICGLEMKREGRLKNNTVVGTVMTNMGLDKFLEEEEIGIVKTKVGDRYILEEMLKNDYMLGGEQSGHIIFLDYNTTGDGLATGLYLMKVMSSTGKKLSQLNSMMEDYPQVLINAEVDNSKKYDYLENDQIREEIERIEEMFHGQGRVVIRPSGTEPLVRVMIEGQDQTEISKIAKDLASFIEERIGD